MADIDTIGRQRKAITTGLDNIMTKLNDHANNPLQVADLEDFNKRLSSALTKAQVCEEAAIPLCKDDAGVVLQANETEKIHDLHRIVKRKMLEIYALVKPPATANPNANLPGVEVKLPRQELPSFNGNYTDWTSFHDLFRSMVHNNTKISSAQKLHYLKSAVQGEAADLLKSIDVTDANYQKAWDLLTTRYDNKRKITLTHVNALLSQDALTVESASGLRKLLDTTTKHLDALSALGIDETKGFDVLKVGLVLNRLDSESRKQYQLHNPGADYPTYANVKTYLEDRARALEDTCDKNYGSKITTHSQQHFDKKPNYANKRFNNGRSVHSVKMGTSKESSSPSSAATACSLCKSAHSLYRCERFVNLDITERRNIVRTSQLCYNCLQSGHAVSHCPSSSTCRKCNGKHHTLLHQISKPDSSSKEGSAGTTKATSLHLSSTPQRKAVIPTALIHVLDAFGQRRECRVLLDTGSEVSLIAESCAQMLGLKRFKSSVPIFGIAETESGPTRGSVIAELVSKLYDFNVRASLFIMPKLTGCMPGNQIEGAESWPHLQCKELADPTFFKPGKIDMILGIDIYDDIMFHGPGSYKTYKNQPSLRKSQFGWVVRGPVHVPTGGEKATQFSCNVCFSDVQQALEKFWEVEDLSSTPIRAPDEIECENHFLATHTRQADGRYIVSLPFKSGKLQLGDSKEQAIRRFFQLERRLGRSEDHRQRYNKFMDEYLSLGHMELIPPEDVKLKETPYGQPFYLPHHFVLKESSSSTKLRVVFDGSAKSSSGTSLNDLLHVGPRLQNDIFDILVRFRQYPYVMIADIEKFFRQVKISPPDSNHQRILWRASPQDPMKEYRLTTVTYGTASAPYLASRALMQLAEDEGERFPIAKEVIQRDSYVDDLMTGEFDIPSALQLQSELIQALAAGQFPLVKWSSNCRELLEAVPESQRETQLPLAMEADDSVKALGLFWNPGADEFFFKVKLPPESSKVTKRTILSDTARLYDPLGLLSPVILKAKIMLQDLWKLELGWDTEVPADFKAHWLQYRRQLQSLENIVIKRQIINNKESTHQIHGFCDASQVGYSAVIYLRSENSSGQVSVNLVCSKTKVAPVKTLSIPRLELCSATLLARLLARIQKILTIPIAKSFAWTDSMDVLAWIAKSPHLWTTFTANRVAEIQTLNKDVSWNHVPGKDNPADCASRGISPPDLIGHDLWWSGPKWLMQDSTHWPRVLQPTDFPTDLPELRPIKVFVATTDQDLDLPSRYSTWLKLKRVTAYCFRFLYNLRSKTNSRPRQIGPLTSDELRAALLHWVKFAQQQAFSKIIDLIKDKKELPGRFAMLDPFLDQAGLLRVGGRLSASDLPFDQKHPMLLPQAHPVTDLIIRDAHHSTLHGMTQLMTTLIRQQFWIFNLKGEIRRCTYQCITCTRQRANIMEQKMSDLPAARVRPGRPFQTTGVDYGGPFMVKSWNGRGAKLYKAYVCLFVCFSTKAVHIELVSDLTTEAFLASLRRFIARRGKPATINSDNGTNFVGASKELLDLRQLVTSELHNNLIADFCSAEGINWNFIPPSAPHHGGLWEAGIKSAKIHMRKIIGDTKLTFEEMTTTLHQIEACLNSRPLTPLSSDPNDLAALTPGHFLVGHALTSAPDPDLSHLNQNRLSRWQLCQQLSQQFWKRWRNEYLGELQQRNKWNQEQDNIAVGDLVFIKEDHLPPLKWMRGRVIKTILGNDQRVRKVTLKAATGLDFKTTTLDRDVRKLCKLPV